MMKYLAAATALLLCVASPAFAMSILPYSTSSVSCSVDVSGQSIDPSAGQTSCSTVVIAPSGAAYASASVSGQSIETDLQDVSLLPPYNTGDYYGELAVASLTYYFQVVGPVDGTTVPLIIETDMTGGAYIVGAGFSSSITAPGVSINRCVVHMLCNDPAKHGIFGATVNSGDIETVQLSVYSDAATGFPLHDQSTVSASIFIDPNFADAAQYSIQYSQFSDAVPEPEVWALLLIGFGLTGFAMRRMRQHALLIAYSIML